MREAYVLDFVETAYLCGATRIDFTIDETALVMEFDGNFRPLNELPTLFTRPVEGAHLRPLARGIAGALKYGAAWVEVCGYRFARNRREPELQTQTTARHCLRLERYPWYRRILQAPSRPQVRPMPRYGVKRAHDWPTREVICLEEWAGFRQPDLYVNGEWLYRVGQEGYPSFTFASQPELLTCDEYQRDLHRDVVVEWSGPPICVTGVLTDWNGTINLVRNHIVFSQHKDLLPHVSLMVSCSEFECVDSSLVRDSLALARRVWLQALVELALPAFERAYVGRIWPGLKLLLSLPQRTSEEQRCLDRLSEQAIFSSAAGSLSLNEARHLGLFLLSGPGESEAVLNLAGVATAYADELDDNKIVKLRHKQQAIAADFAQARIGEGNARVALYPEGRLEFDFPRCEALETTATGLRRLDLGRLQHNELLVETSQGDLKETTHFYWLLSDGHTEFTYRDREVRYYESLPEPTGRQGVGRQLDTLRQLVGKPHPTECENR